MTLRTILSGSSGRRRRVAATVATAIATVAAVCAGTPAASAAATVVRIDKNGQQWQMYVKSPAMGRTMHLDVLVPANQSASRPTLLLLDGNGARENMARSTWVTQGGAVQLLQDKQINVVMPVGGGGSFYTDWQKDDPTLGRLKWETFLTEELPPLITQELKGNGKYAIGGLSMGAHPAVLLAERHPSMFRAVASMSGCLFSDSLANLGQFSVREVVKAVGGNPDNMWGPANSSGWNTHDPSRYFDKMRGKPFYIYVGSGVPGINDGLFDFGGNWPNNLERAAAIEHIAHDCTVAGVAKMKLQGVNPTLDYNLLGGVHSWPYWKAALEKSWPTLKAGLGV